jgi:hypothetical protein
MSTEGTTRCSKLGCPDEADNRRVLAVLRYLGSPPTGEA